jgi:predicted dehydrogenase
MAAHYLPVYQNLDWVRIVNLIDPAIPDSPPFEAALTDEIDAVIINTPNHLHRPQAVAAIEAGKHVLLQKPVAPSVAEAEAIQAAAEKSTRTVGLYMSYFDQPMVHDLRDIIRDGRMGNIVHCYARLMHKGGMMWSNEVLGGKPNWRGRVTETGGGCFIQLAVHYLHIFEWVTGAHVTRATGFKRNLHCPGLEGEDLAVGVFDFDSGAMATIDTAWCTNGEELAIHGTDGRCVYRDNQLSIRSTRGPFSARVLRYDGCLAPAFGGPQGEEQIMEIKPPGFADLTNPLNQHLQFLEAVRDGRPAPVSIASGVRDLRIVDALYRSTVDGRAVEVA